MKTVQRYDAVSLPAQGFQSTPQGGLRGRGRFTRSGVLEYKLPDGTARHEWRPPEEVFAPESYQTLWDAPVTVHHPVSGQVDGGNYRRDTVGHVCSDVAPDADEFLAGTAVIQDESTVRMTLGGHLSEFSAGYLSILEMTAGVVPDGMPDAGKPYHCIQRRIRYNHVAYLPPGLGRAGAQVSWRLDSKGNQLGPITTKDNKNMELTPEELAALKALAALAPKLQALVAAPAPAPAVPAPAPVVNNDAPPPAPPAAAPAVTEEPEKKNDSKGDKAPAKVEPKPLTAEQHERMVNDSIELRDQARQVLGADYNFKGKSNQQVMIDVVKHVDSAFELGARSQDYLQGKFESALERVSEREHMQLRSATTLHTDSADDEFGDDDNRLKNQISGKKAAGK